MPNPVKPIDFNKTVDMNSSIPNFTNLNTQQKMPDFNPSM